MRSCTAALWQNHVTIAYFTLIREAPAFRLTVPYVMRAHRYSSAIQTRICETSLVLKNIFNLSLVALGSELQLLHIILYAISTHVESSDRDVSNDSKFLVIEA